MSVSSNTLDEFFSKMFLHFDLYLCPIFYSLYSDLEHKKQKLDSEINMLTKDADEMAVQAEEQSNMSLLTKSNALRKAANDKKEMLLSFQEEIRKLKEQI